MALSVETGSGGDSFGSVADWKTWATGRGRDYASFADADIEAALRLGFDYINTARRYKGYISQASTQVGAFPREGLTDWDGRTVTGVPQRVIWANFELAWAKLTSGADLYQDQERGGRVASESVGPISVSYFADAPSQKVFTAAMRLLDPYARSNQDAYPPFIGGAAGQASTEEAPTSLTPLFGLNMHSNNVD
ncbi:MAG: hypothetical protein KJZ75_11200 [Hyphomonadaceae bacterium]|nr:hypothetical protein [Hyphomonadaceae bacterium]